jgi:antitoxin (DNA-binding transcriptional repressor) of toxin-antitoxin stability system
MKAATVRDLRNHFPRVAHWIEEGEPVEITRSGKVIAHLVPVTRPAQRRFRMPDIMARLEQTFGSRCYDAENIAQGLAESRGDNS